MLTGDNSKPSRILPGDEYESFGAISPKKKSKNKNKNNKYNNNSNDGFGSFGFDVGLSSTGSLTNPFGRDISDYDIEVSYTALSALSEDKRVTNEQFTQWINDYLQLKWDESRIKRAWNELDHDKKKYITFKEFRNGLKSTNSDVILFYSNLMV